MSRKAANIDLHKSSENDGLQKSSEYMICRKATNIDLKKNNDNRFTEKLHRFEEKQ